MDDRRRLLWVAKTAAAGLLCGMLLSPRLWLSGRLYPLTPVFSFLRPIPSPFDYIVFALLIGLLTAIVVAPKPRVLIFAAIGLIVVLGLFDQSRWQPWCYLYVFLLAAPGLNTCRLIVASTYFWSGVQKINPNFVSSIFDWVIEPVTRFLPPAVRPFADSLGFGAPVVEIAIGVGLLTNRFRSKAIGLAIVTHAFLLLAIGPLGRNANTVVWPWNIAMPVLVLFLFYRAGVQRPVSSSLNLLVVLLFCIAPLLSLFNLWDSYLSASLYSGNKNTGTIYLTDSVFDRLPEGIADYVTGDRGLHRLDIADWSFGELNVPAYPEVRVFKNVTRSICGYSQEPSDVKLVVHRKAAPWRGGGSEVYDCPENVLTKRK